MAAAVTADTFNGPNQRGLIRPIAAGQTATATLAPACGLRFQPTGGDWQDVASPFVAPGTGSVRIEGSGTPQTPVTVTLEVTP